MIKSDVIPEVFHIGYQRTGTTWIQKGLLPTITDKVFVPKSRQWQIYHATTPADVAGIYQDIELKTVSGRIVLETEEGLSGGRYRDYLEMAQKISWVNPHARILICVRSQKDVLASLYYLYVRKGGVLNFAAYVRLILENRKLDYWSLYSSYVNVFSAENVKILFFEDLAQDPLKYVRDFCEWLGVSAPLEIPDQQFKNPRTNSILTEYLRWLNKLTGINNLVKGLHDNRPIELEKKLYKRRILFKPISLVFSKFERFILNPKYEVLNFEHELDEIYGPGNQHLFKMMNRDIRNTTYPGSS